MATDKKTRDYTCRIWVPTNRTVTVELNGMEYLVPNFRVWEFANTEAKESVKLVISQRSWEFIKELQAFRDRYYAKYKKGLDVSSMYRTETFNRACGGSVNSAHLNGRACDFINIPQSRYDAVTNMWKEVCSVYGKIGGINYYADNRIHVTDFEQKFGHSQFYIRDYRKTKIIREGE